MKFKKTREVCKILGKSLIQFYVLNISMHGIKIAMKLRDICLLFYPISGVKHTNVRWKIVSIFKTSFICYVNFEQFLLWKYLIYKISQVHDIVDK